MSARLEIAVVPISEEHIESYHSCLVEVCRERQALAFYEPPQLESTRDFVRQNLLVCNPQFVALSEGRAVGWCDIIRVDQPTRAHTGILGMGVVREFRRGGIGRRLLLAASERAAQLYFDRVELTVYASNTAAIRLYESAGFIRDAVQPDPCKIDGLYQDAVAMVKVLPSAAR